MCEKCNWNQLNHLVVNSCILSESAMALKLNVNKNKNLFYFRNRAILQLRFSFLFDVSPTKNWAEKVRKNDKGHCTFVHVPNHPEHNLRAFYILLFFFSFFLSAHLLNYTIIYIFLAPIHLFCFIYYFFLNQIAFIGIHTHTIIVIKYEYFVWFGWEAGSPLK